MTKETKFNFITWVVFVISWALGLVFGDGNLKEWTDYIPVTLILGGLIWLILRLNGFLKFK